MSGGTFSHRHAVLVDMKTGERYVPLNTLAPDQAELCVYEQGAILTRLNDTHHLCTPSLTERGPQ